jgi:hypothetical protein
MPRHWGVKLRKGKVPSGAIAAELRATARRAFVSKLVVDLYKSTPLLSLLLKPKLHIFERWRRRLMKNATTE